MLADCDIPSLTNGMKIAVQKNPLRCGILYRIPDPFKKRDIFDQEFLYFLLFSKTNTIYLRLRFICN